MLATWPPGAAQPIFQDPNMSPGYPDGFPPGPLNIVGNPGRHNFQGNNRQRFQNNHQKHHREPQSDRTERDMQRNRQQNSANANNNNGGGVPNNVTNRVPGFNRPRENREDDYARRTLRNRRRRGSSEDVSKHMQQVVEQQPPFNHQHFQFPPPIFNGTQEAGLNW
ncbi:PREDICTED: WD repeat-containing protein 24 homolog [Acropora digitifera]|uniref:WD repeat-containing protein 24 homolog n=1 Tax=Acropora digitifera TaxID=70779 RepID=UPI00077A69AD|nr:PREDICTED: WD repeat-containing protein 24 homolog [Acropora digitifera]